MLLLHKLVSADIDFFSVYVFSESIIYFKVIFIYSFSILYECVCWTQQQCYCDFNSTLFRQLLYASIRNRMYMDVFKMYDSWPMLFTMQSLFFQLFPPGLDDLEHAMSSQSWLHTETHFHCCWWSHLYEMKTLHIAWKTFSALGMHGISNAVKMCNFRFCY